MREILFRGKRIDNNEWVEGYYVKITSTAEVFHQSYKVIVHSIFSSEENFVKVEVIPETVGQYTGLKDMNGVKIFEGDIIKHNVMYSEGGKTIKHEDQLFTIRYSTDQARFLALLPNGVFNPVAMQNCVVVGNIHDDPGLLEEEKNE